MMNMMNAGGMIGSLGWVWAAVWTINSVLIMVLLLKLIDHKTKK